MNLQVGDHIRYKDMPAQTGCITRLHPLGIQSAIEVDMDSDGPMYTMHEPRALFGKDVELVEKYTPVP